MQDMVAVSALTTAAVSAIGLIATWVKNGRSQTRRDQRLESNQEQILKRLDDKDSGLAALDRKIGGMQTRCADISGRLDERVKATEHDVNELRRGGK